MVEFSQIWLSVTSIYILRVSDSHTPCLQETLQAVGRSGPGSYQITTFALGPGMHQILCASFKSEVCISVLWGS